MNKNTNNKAVKCGDYEIFERKTKKCSKVSQKVLLSALLIIEHRQIKQKQNQNQKRKKIRKIQQDQTHANAHMFMKHVLKVEDSLEKHHYDMVEMENQQESDLLKKADPGKYGYHHLDKISKTERKRSLRLAVAEMGAPRVVRKLGAIRTYLKNTSPQVSAKFYEDQKWVRKTFDDEFKGDYKQSALFNKNI